MMDDEKSNNSKESIQKRLTGPHWAKWMVVWAFSMILDLKEWLKNPRIEIEDYNRFWFKAIHILHHPLSTTRA